MNRENVLKVADRIANLPYDTKLDGGGKPEAFNMSCGCGSSCCIAGWTGEVFGLVESVNMGRFNYSGVGL